MVLAVTLFIDPVLQTGSMNNRVVSLIPGGLRAAEGLTSKFCTKLRSYFSSCF